MAKVNVTSTVSSVTLSPLARVVRTVLQTVVAYGASFPVLIAGLHLSGTTSAQVGAVISGIVFVASAVENTLEHFNVLPTLGAKLPTTTK